MRNKKRWWFYIFSYLLDILIKSALELQFLSSPLKYSAYILSRRTFLPCVQTWFYKIQVYHTIFLKPQFHPGFRNNKHLKYISHPIGINIWSPYYVHLS